MIKCIELGTGNPIGEVEEALFGSNYEHYHNDYKYRFKHMLKSENEKIAFFTRENFNILIENNFSYHPPKEEGQPEKYTQIREKAKELAYLIDKLTPSSREKSLAMTNLEQSVFWVNAAIARND